MGDRRPWSAAASAPPRPAARICRAGTASCRRSSEAASIFRHPAGSPPDFESGQRFAGAIEQRLQPSPSGAGLPVFGGQRAASPRTDACVSAAERPWPPPSTLPCGSKPAGASTARSWSSCEQQELLGESFLQAAAGSGAGRVAESRGSILITAKPRSSALRSGRRT